MCIISIEMPLVSIKLDQASGKCLTTVFNLFTYFKLIQTFFKVKPSSVAEIQPFYFTKDAQLVLNINDIVSG